MATEKKGESHDDHFLKWFADFVKDWPRYNIDKIEFHFDNCTFNSPIVMQSAGDGGPKDPPD